MDDGKSVRRNTNAIVLFSKAASVQSGGKDDPFAGLPWTDFDSLFSAMFDDILEQATRVPNTDIIVYRDKTEFSEEALQHFSRAVKCHDVVGKDQGEQLKHAVENAVSLGYQRILVVLENNPLIDTLFLRRIFEQLQYEDECVILGPNIEGTYHLLAFKNTTPLVVGPGEELQAVADGILKQVCAAEAVLFLSSQRYALTTGPNLNRLKNEIAVHTGRPDEFPHRTHAAFAEFDKRYKLKRTTS